MDAALFRLAQERQQQLECDRLAHELPLPQIHLAHQFTTRLGRSHLAGLAEELVEQLDAMATVP
jgi:hypothetical protein